MSGYLPARPRHEPSPMVPLTSLLVTRSVDQGASSQTSSVLLAPLGFPVCWHLDGEDREWNDPCTNHYAMPEWCAQQIEMCRDILVQAKGDLTQKNHYLRPSSHEEQ